MRQWSTSATNALGLLGEGLYEFGYGMGSDPQLGLAEAVTTSEDGLTWTFKLRPSLVFSDGTDLTSADVKATLDRMRTDEANVYAFFMGPLTGVDAPDPSTVVVHLSRPYPSLPRILAEAPSSIYPASAYSQDESYWSNPISAGPYRLSAPWDGGPNLQLVVNDKFWGPKPVIPEINFTTITDFNTALAQLQTGQIDMAEALPMSIQPQLATAEGITTNLVSTYGFVGFPMNNNVEPFDDPGVRKAVSLALDRDQMNEVAWRGLGQPLAGFWPQTMDGYDPSISTARDVAGAKALLQGTACESGCTVELAYSAQNGGWASQLAQIAAANLADIGITANVTSFSDIQWNNDVVNDQNYQIAVTFMYDYVDIPDGILEYTVNPDSYYHAFYTGWQNPELAALIDAADTANDAGRPAALAAINKVFLEDQPFATVNTYTDLWAQRVPTTFVQPEQTDQITVARASE